MADDRDSPDDDPEEDEPEEDGLRVTVEPGDHGGPMGDLLDMLKHAAGGDAPPVGAAEAADLADRLHVLYARWGERHRFEPGGLVMWKVGLRNKRRPRPGEPAVVVEVKEKPIFDAGKESGSPYFREPLDVVAGVLDQDGDFMLCHLDSRRLRPFEDSDDAAELAAHGPSEAGGRGGP